MPGHMVPRSLPEYVSFRCRRLVFGRLQAGCRRAPAAAFAAAFFPPVCCLVVAAAVGHHGCGQRRASRSKLAPRSNWAKFGPMSPNSEIQFVACLANYGRPGPNVAGLGQLWTELGQLWGRAGQHRPARVKLRSHSVGIRGGRADLVELGPKSAKFWWPTRTSIGQLWPESAKFGTIWAAGSAFGGLTDTRSARGGFNARPSLRRVSDMVCASRSVHVLCVLPQTTFGRIRPQSSDLNENRCMWQRHILWPRADPISV